MSVKFKLTHIKTKTKLLEMIKMKLCFKWARIWIVSKNLNDIIVYECVDLVLSSLSDLNAVGVDDPKLMQA